ncbi:MAG: HEAT repeat domain-containing protein, partial [Planctomycetota bacterium]
MVFEISLRRRGWLEAVAIVTLVALWDAPALRADEIHLTSGAVVEGVPVDEGGDVLRLRTPSGVLGIPRVVVARQVPGPTRWTRYEREKSRASLSAGRHVQLARWCRDNNLPRFREEHIREALTLEPTHTEALVEAGYVRIGDVWMKAFSPPSQQELEEAAAALREQQTAIVEHLVHGWQLRIRGLHEGYLKSGGGGRHPGRSGVGEGRRRLEDLEEPLALLAACSVLSDQDVRSRILLVELLGGWEADTASLNLLGMVLLDDDTTVRAAGAEALAERKDPRASRQLRYVLSCRHDRLVRRAAHALGL